MADNTLRPGALIDQRFLLGRRLGAGSTGVVWLAQDQANGRDVALKILHPKMSHDAMLVAQLAREADVLQQLDHPHIAGSYAFQSNGPFVYLAMEFIDGQPLHEVIGTHTREKRYFEHVEVMEILSQLADAVGYAHAKYIVHRDLKPQNVIVTGEGRDVQVKVLDFGIARLLEGSIFDATTLGRQLGSLFYMSPEQTRGEPADARSDVFALGVILFELVTLRRAWAWDENGVPIPAFERPVPHGEANALAAVFTRLTSGPRPRVSDVRLEIPPSFDAIITRALAVKREDRYASVQELAREALAGLERITGSVEAATVLAAAVDRAGFRAPSDSMQGTQIESSEFSVASSEFAQTALLQAADEGALGAATMADDLDAGDPITHGDFTDTIEGSASLETAPPGALAPHGVAPEHSGRSKRDYPETIEYRSASEPPPDRRPRKREVDEREAPAVTRAPAGRLIERAELPRFEQAVAVTAVAATKENPVAQEPVRLLPIVAVAIVSMLLAIAVGLVIFEPDRAPERIEPTNAPKSTRHEELWARLSTVKKHPNDAGAMTLLTQGIVAATEEIADAETAKTIVACAKGNELLKNAAGMENCLRRLEAATKPR